jgi:prefoldin subunit 5
MKKDNTMLSLNNQLNYLTSIIGNLNAEIEALKCKIDKLEKEGDNDQKTIASILKILDKNGHIPTPHPCQHHDQFGSFYK